METIAFIMSIIPLLVMLFIYQPTSRSILIQAKNIPARLSYFFFTSIFLVVLLTYVQPNFSHNSAFNAITLIILIVDIILVSNNQYGLTQSKLYTIQGELKYKNVKSIQLNKYKNNLELIVTSNDLTTYTLYIKHKYYYKLISLINKTFYNIEFNNTIDL